MISAENALNSMPEPKVINTPDKPGTANHNNSSTDKNTGNDARANNREILIIKIKTVKSTTSSLGGFCRRFNQDRITNACCNGQSL